MKKQLFVKLPGIRSDAFKRFAEASRKLVTVPKDELDQAEQQWRKHKNQKPSSDESR